jgi:flavorubredoxin
MSTTVNPTTDPAGAAPQPEPAGPPPGPGGPPPSPRHLPVEVAPETWVIQATVGEGVAPQAVHQNAMVIRGAEPTVVDTGCAIHRDTYLEDLFSIVEPEDVRWVFISHDDADHYGNLNEVMAACPNATLVATWFLCERLGVDDLRVPPTRWRWVGDGESFDAGDRTFTAIRPPLYDSPTTRGLLDSRTGVYWASDCFATPVERGTAFVEELDPAAWAEGFNTFQHWNSPWVSMVDHDAYDAACNRLEALGISTIAGTHGPTVEASDIATAFDLLRAVPRLASPPQPGQPVLDGIVAAMTAATAPA